MTKRKKKSKRRRGSRKNLWLPIIAICLVAIAIWAAVFLSRRYSGEEAWIYVSAGADREQVDSALVATLGDEAGGRVYTLWRLMGGDVRTAHGAYCIQNGDRCISIAKRLADGRQTPVKASWHDSRSLENMAEKLTESLEITPGQFVEAVKRILPEKGYGSNEFMSAFLPDTYEFYWTTSADDAVERLLEYGGRFWNEERREKASALGLTPKEVCTLASIVEEETNKMEERGMVARVYLNRLKQGMKLQADPTVKFAVGDESLRRITGEHLKYDSPFNTYIYKGLPPGPIRIVDKRTIDAVLDAPVHKYIYMCAKEDFSGYHNFAADYSTHLANARRYQAELNKRGIH